MFLFLAHSGLLEAEIWPFSGSHLIDDGAVRKKNPQNLIFAIINAANSFGIIS
jgi:hypothetical protein